MFTANRIIFTVFFVNFDENQSPAHMTDYFTTILGVLMIPTIFYAGIRSDKN